MPITKVPSITADPQSLMMLLTVVSSAGSEREGARLLASGMSTLIPCRVCWVALLQAPDAEWYVVDQLGQAATLSDADHNRLNKIQKAIESRGASLHIDAKQSSDALQVPTCLAEHGVTSVAAVPLATLRSQLGVLMAERKDSDRFSAEEMVLLETFTQNLAVTIENFRLAESLEQSNRNLQHLVDERTSQLRHSEQRQRALLEINNAIIANLNRESMFAAVSESMEKVSPFDRATLVLHDPKRDVLKVYGLAGTSTEQVAPVGTEFPRDGRHVDVVFRSRTSHFRADLQSGQRTDLEKNLFDSGIRSYVAVPLIAKTRVVGSLNLASRSAHQFAEDDADFLLEVGNQVALAIENTLAYERIEELQKQLASENEYLREQDSKARGFGEIIGQSPSLRQVLQQVQLVAPTDANVIIFGESGTGKELIARAIHEQSSRSDGPLIRVNCAAIPRELFESEFFGHVKGAFTGAVSDRAGRFQLADGGTLFLDEVGEIPLDMQSKLLRVLQEGEFERVGEECTQQVDVRIVAATNRNLKQDSEAKRFREDLYYRLSVFPIQIAPLCERKEDISVLAAHFVDLSSRNLNRPVPRLTQGNILHLQRYEWPGNIRELQNVIERAVITSVSGRLKFDLPTAERGKRSGPPDAPKTIEGTAEPEIITDEEMRRCDRENILAALMRTKWKISGEDGAAELLGIKPTTLTSRMKKMGIERPV